MATIVSLLTLAMTFLATFAACWVARDTARLLKATTDPTLVFWRNSDDRPWTIRNVGKGPAVNVLIQGRSSKGDLSKCYRYHSFSADEIRENMAEFGDVLIAVYS